MRTFHKICLVEFRTRHVVKCFRVLVGLATDSALLTCAGVTAASLESMGVNK